MRHRLLATAFAMAVLAVPAAAQPLFWSTQAGAGEEARAMREEVLAGFPGGVDYRVADAGPWLERLEGETATGGGSIAVLGALHGDFAALAPQLADLSDTDTSAVLPALTEFARLGTAEQKYVPWMQATYLMAADRRALAYLPADAPLEALTYDQLIAWAKALAEGTGGPKFGLPAGPEGLMHRFLQGYLLPSYTGSTVTEFRSEAAAEAWAALRELWRSASPASTGYGFMQAPLLSGEVWVAWDHAARLAAAFDARPDDLVAFPPPAGPAGRAFMPVVAGLAVPVSAPDLAASKRLIAYMLEPTTQVATLRATGFLPVVDTALPDDLPPSVRQTGAAISALTASPDVLPVLLPVGLGELDGRFNQVYVDTFRRIVLEGQDIRQVLAEEGETLAGILGEAGAPCWAPDPPSEGPCPVD